MVIVDCAEDYKSQQKQFVEDVKAVGIADGPCRGMADPFNVYALCTASVDGYDANTSTFLLRPPKEKFLLTKGTGATMFWSAS